LGKDERENLKKGVTPKRASSSWGWTSAVNGGLLLGRREKKTTP